MKKIDLRSKLILGIAVAVLAFAVAVVAVKVYMMWQRQAGVEIPQLVDFVDAAAMHVSEKGEMALADFKDVNGGWIDGDRYIFVYDLNGKTLVLPPQPELEGTNRLVAQDPDGKFFIKDMLDILKIKDAGWIEYKYAKPGEDEVSTKLSYFRKVRFDGARYLLGSGIYLNN